MRRKTGQVRRERGQVGTLLLSHSYLQHGTGGPGQAAQGRLPDRAGLQWSQCSAQAVWAPADFPGTGHWHSYRSLRLLLGHRIGFTQVSQAPPPCLARKIANKKSSLLPVSSWHQLTGILVRHRHLVKVKRDQTR